MLRALAMALTGMFDRRLVPIWLKSLGATVLVFVLLGLAVWRGLVGLIDRYAGSLNLDPGLTEVLAFLVAALAGWLVWRIIALAVLQFFADDVVLAVEARDYPEMAAQARKLGLPEEARRALGGAGRAILFNLLALPVALVLAATGLGPPLVFLFVNAVLLGRELQDMVWLRHRRDPAEPAPLSALERFALGGCTALLLTVPIANFVAPFLGAACAVHLIHRKGRPSL
ncbi:MAG TPA: EI24 domain-containing protein [Novosphingobium sp.]|nr:EI24 domain-containing protein [Novosphingobium sp.]HQA16814.1 EI24 domain-containing protein [Novosphingobium sp.]